MSDLRPMIEETRDETERALLREARDYAAGPETRRRTLDALGLAAPGGGASWLRGAGWKVVLGVVVVGAAAGLYLTRKAPATTGEPVLPAHTAAPELPPAAVATAPAPAVATADTADRPAGGAAAAVATAPRRAAAASHTAALRPTASNSSLPEEIAAIDRARQALYASDKEAAIRALDDYDRRFPSGSLAPESKKLRARAEALR